uniref:Calmodulin n=1 Tax=Chromera velia CCMP2878 TaxID=1169474 RepID=A0A0G4HV52_9ALVE|eukprot:Cvel_1395.t1-p1 / transcript=Cvel_1395.t1 / gene=Cvel_1395 / organism=Chromera_velia_CCMP2878 / gene_product=Calcium-dependent protein kinase 3, putative / transcript_product=Calcium-dependent protein kinase 3, putative / location=Cvel_scaffold48:131742-138808(-) / protein_length=994 / sequence_SO=supercontig / SO=protein_coding / is_pseudo=false
MCADDYRFMHDRVIGTGFSGPVRLAKDKGTGEEVAVKTFFKKGMTEERIDLLRNEALIYLNLDHPNIVKLIALYEDRKRVYLVMEYCKGRELFHRLGAKQSYSESEAARVTLQMLQALQYLHCHNVVHRDLKLENWLYEDRSEGARLKLIDFGFSLIWNPISSPKMHATCGSLAYVSPDTLSGSYTNACDMWSLGVIVYMLLVGTPPFSGTQKEILHGITRCQYKMEGEQWDRVSEDAKDFVRSLLVKPAEKRLTAEQALEHRWIQQGAAAIETPPLDRSVLESMRKFALSTHLKRAALTMMAYSLSCKEIQELPAMFLKFDRDNSGTISLEDFQKVMTEHFSDIDHVEIEALFHALAERHTKPEAPAFNAFRRARVISAGSSGEMMASPKEKEEGRERENQEPKSRAASPLSPSSPPLGVLEASSKKDTTDNHTHTVPKQSSSMPATMGEGDCGDTQEGKLQRDTERAASLQTFHSHASPPLSCSAAPTTSPSPDATDTRPRLPSQSDEGHATGDSAGEAGERKSEDAFPLSSPKENEKNGEEEGDKKERIRMIVSPPPLATTTPQSQEGDPTKEASEEAVMSPPTPRSRQRMQPHRDGCMEILYSDFVAMMLTTRVKLFEGVVRQAFRRFDVDKTGRISVENLRYVLGKSFEGEQIEEILREADVDGDGGIDYEEFLHAVMNDGEAENGPGLGDGGNEAVQKKLEERQWRTLAGVIDREFCRKSLDKGRGGVGGKLLGAPDFFNRSGAKRNHLPPPARPSAASPKGPPGPNPKAGRPARLLRPTRSVASGGGDSSLPVSPATPGEEMGGSARLQEQINDLDTPIGGHPPPPFHSSGIAVGSSKPAGSSRVRRRSWRSPLPFLCGAKPSIEDLKNAQQRLHQQPLGGSGGANPVMPYRGDRSLEVPEGNGNGGGGDEEMPPMGPVRLEAVGGKLSPKGRPLTPRLIEGERDCQGGEFGEQFAFEMGVEAAEGGDAEGFEGRLGGGGRERSDTL